MEPLNLTRPYRIGEWRIDPALDEMYRADVRVKLEPRMTRLLSCLAARPGEVVSTSQLLDEVWAGVIVSQSSVYQAVAHLRRMFGDSESTPRYIATVPRKGYRLVAEVSSAPPSDSNGARTAEAAAERAPEELRTLAVAPAVSSDAPRTMPRPGSRWRVATAAVLAIAAVAVFLFAWLTGPEDESAPHTPPAVAVLPFEDLSIDASNGAFCDGLTDELLNALAHIPGLRVTGRTSTLQFRDGDVDARRVGRLLDVTHLLEGSVRRSGARVRISAQLVRTADGFQIWGNSYDRPADDIITIQSQIARAVVDALALQLSPETATRLERPPTTHISAYELYLLGRYQQIRRKPEALARAIDYHKAALEADPRFALAHAGLADAYMAGYYYEGRSLNDTAKLVQPEIDAALRLDPELAEAYAAWAVLLTEQWHTDEAIAALKRAIAINSNYSEAYLRLGAAYEYSGEPGEALRTYEQVAVIDPLNTVLHVRRCLVLQNLGRYVEAERSCERGFELQPDIPNALWASGLAAYAQGDLLGAVGHYRGALARAPDRTDIRAELATLYLDLGMLEASAAEFEQLRAANSGPAQALAFGRWYLAAGDKDGLRQYLKRLRLDSVAPRDRLDAAFLALAAEDTSLAAELAGLGSASAGRARDEDFAPSLYRTRWGICELCALSLLSRLRGDTTAAAAQASAAAAALDRMEAQGHVWHGLHYLRAGLHAQRGDSKAALASLQRAVDLGWRRAWLMAADPALAPLRDEPGFRALLARIEAANQPAVARLASVPSR